MQIGKVSIIFAFLVFSVVYAAEKTTIAVLELEPKGVQANEASVISDWVREELFNTGKYTVVERTRMQDILKEWGFQQAICNESECIIKAGNILGVEQMVAGSVQRIGSLLSLSIRVVDVKTGEIVAMANSPCTQCSIEDFALRSVRTAVADLTRTAPLKEQEVISGGATPTGRIGEKVTGPVAGMEFVYIPGGSFMMGSPNTEEEGPQHQVTLQPFYMMNTEVTHAQWKAVMNSNPSSFKGDSLPVETVSWNDCQEFIRELNKMDPGKGYRLPSEAEREYACRAGTYTRFYSGNSESDLDRVGWYSGNSGSKMHPVGTKEPNAWGLYDMHGNVFEWCQDWYHGNYFGAPSFGSAWESGGGQYRVLRGGSWISGCVKGCPSASRDCSDLDARSANIGFRLVRSQ
jgi:formylglycine-generating enzyme required for sulfatase activity